MLLVSIIIPTYNQENLVEKAVLSSVKQTYSNIEVIVIDDASADNTTKIIAALCEKYQNVHYYRNPENIGRVKTYHKGLYELANGDFSIILDGDDYFTDNSFIEKAIAEIEDAQSENVLFFQANHHKVYDDEKIPVILNNTADFNVKSYSAKKYLLHFHKIGFSHLASLVNRKLALQNNFYTADILSSDIDSFLRLCANYPDKKVLKTDAKIGVWLKHSSNTSSSKSIKKLLPSLRIYFNVASQKSNADLGLSKWWALRQSIKPLLSVILRKAGLIR